MIYYIFYLKWMLREKEKRDTTEIYKTNPLLEEACTIWPHGEAVGA